MNLDAKRKENLEKLLKAKEKLGQLEKYPTIDKGAALFSTFNDKMKGLTSSNSLQEKVDLMQKESCKEVCEVLKNRKADTAEIVFIFDKSGSCSGSEDITIQGFMGVLENEKNNLRSDIVSTILFDTKSTVIHDRIPLEYVRKFNYVADGGTALYDTLITQIQRIRDKQKKDLQKPKNTLVVIMTDGEDIHSKKNSSYDCRKLIKECINDGWEFIYLGVNVEIAEEANMLGIPCSNAVEYNPLKLENNFAAIKKALADIHKTGKVSGEWSNPITENRELGKPKQKLLGENYERK